MVAGWVRERLAFVGAILCRKSNVCQGRLGTNICKVETETRFYRSPYAYPPGFVHTSYAMFTGSGNSSHKNCTTGLCPPLDMFEAHNEWFYPHDDSSLYGQLCWTNQSLIEYLLREYMKIFAMPLRFKLGGRPVLSARLNVETAGSERKQPEI
jgi:hypothetical protein